ncbi:ATP-binding response regulator [Sinimarinibacterium flocculans]|uniref:ATP-binding response regulator n=1 Tax=Sinimarinibacterium flocculans TaxID=985250 RepID=UPI0024901222|nr:hybrid sensor histidine kinase/response regulator [Sinimarinibacterium flocculans]
MPNSGSRTATPDLTPAPSVVEDAPRSLHGELVLLIAGQARRIPIERYLTSVLLAALLCVYLPPFAPLAWAALVLGVLALRTRWLLRLADDGDRSDEDKLRHIAWLFWLSGVVQAAVVGFFAFVPVAIAAVITIYVVGVCSATLHATAGFRTVCVPYTLIMMLPVAIAWVLAPNLDVTVLERVVFGALTLIYITTLLSHARGLHEVFADSYRIRLQRLELNLRLREALDRAELANQAKTRFLASASHDLRQPIHALSLFSGSLLLRPMDDRTGAIARQIDQAVQSLASQLDALLDISRLDAGVIESAISTVDLHLLLTQLTEEFRPQAEDKKLRLDLRCERGLMVRTDPMLLQRILRNLLSNAIKYTDRGSVELVGARDGRRCGVSVRDTGRGIPDAEHARIFEEFYQLQNPERDRSKGLGLGLAIVRRLTDLLGVELRLESAPGAGSCFRIELPLARAEDASVPEGTMAEDGVAPRIQVLVVDDEEAIRVGMKTLLEEMGFEVQVAASTDAAIDASRRFRPSIVLADFRLRGEDSGIRAIEALRMVWPELPALLISGDTAPDRLREARGAGVELLHKPVPALALRESILKAVHV